MRKKADADAGNAVRNKAVLKSAKAQTAAFLDTNSETMPMTARTRPRQGHLPRHELAEKAAPSSYAANLAR